MGKLSAELFSFMVTEHQLGAPEEGESKLGNAFSRGFVTRKQYLKAFKHYWKVKKSFGRMKQSFSTPRNEFQLFANPARSWLQQVRDCGVSSCL